MTLRKKRLIAIIFAALTGLLVFAGGSVLAYRQYLAQKNSWQQQLSAANQELTDFKSADQVLINQALEASISAIKTTYLQTVTAYEGLLDLEDSGASIDKLQPQLTKILNYLSDVNYASAQAQLALLTKDITDLEKTFLSSKAPSTASLPVSNTPPAVGLGRQNVSTDVGQFAVTLVSADLGSTKVVIDTASDSDCHDNCPVLPLATYVARSGAIAGVNGSYFCPASYPSCAGKTNSFDTLLMNKNKKYFNSDNNVYSTVPAAIFSSSARFVGQSLEWGRDTGVDAVIANHPLLLSGGNITFGGNADPKTGSRAGRSFVGSKGSTVYIGVVHNATVVEAAHALKALGLDNALNLDSGGSTAFYSGGYKAGPGRDIPNAVLLVPR